MKCPGCESRFRILLGRLGHLVWYRCRACGIDFNRKIPGNRGQIGTAPTKSSGGSR